MRVMFKKFKEIILFLLGFKPKIKEDDNLLERKEIEITALIPAYNEEKDIADTIISLKKQTYPVKEIIVIDDCSTDKTHEIAENLGVKVVKTLQNTGRKGEALNFGLQFIKTEYFLIIDADTIVEERAIEALVNQLQKKTISVCGFVLPKTIKTFWERVRSIQYLVSFSLYKNTQFYWGAITVVSGCFSLWKTSFVKAVNIFSFPTVAEDMALTWEALLKGESIDFVPEALCFAKDPPTWKIYRQQLLRWNRGFFQCLKFFRTELKRKPTLMFFVWWYFFSGLISPILWLLGINEFITLVQGYSSIIYGNIIWIPVIFTEILINFLLVISMAYKLKCLKGSILNFFLFVIESPLDSLLFWEATIREIFSKQRMVWEKGH